MALKITRALFVLACLVMGVIWTNYALDMMAESQTVPISEGSRTLWYIFGGALGAAGAIAIQLTLRFVTQEVFERLFPVVIAIVLAILIGYGVAQYTKFFWPVRPGNESDVIRHVYTTSTLVLLFGFIGIFLGLTKASSWEALVSVVRKRHIEYGSPKIVDTSVLIDGRIKDIIDSGFLEGTLIIPRFVLKELQHIADSADVLRRTKGRRGLDILRDLQSEDSGIDVEIVHDNPPELEEVDEKIVSIAKEYSARILTTDYNLNKVAQIEGIDVLNINDLANALKPAALPDESLDVKIIKEGKEADQGVGYLDDGTMIVVDGGRSFVGKRVSVTVTSVLQTAAGRMIFTKVAGSGSGSPEPAHQAL